MGSDLRFQLKAAVETNALTPVTVSDELKRKFLKKVGFSSLKYLPLSIIAVVVVLHILVVIKLHLEDFFVPVLFCGIAFIFVGLLSPFFLIYNLFANAIAIRRRNYGFYEGEITDVIDDGYEISGLKGHTIEPFIGKKNYEPGGKVIVARLKNEFYLISE